MRSNQRQSTKKKKERSKLHEKKERKVERERERETHHLLHHHNINTNLFIQRKHLQQFHRKEKQNNRIKNIRKFVVFFMGFDTMQNESSDK